MKKRPQTKFHKQLKEWKVYRLEGNSSWIEIECPQKDCGYSAFVKRGPWLHNKLRSRFIGRSCPYCFKTARIPEAFL